MGSRYGPVIFLILSSGWGRLGSLQRSLAVEALCTRRAGMDRLWTGFEVVDCSYQPIGTLFSLWYHERSDAVQFFGVQTAGTAGKGLVVPAEGVQVDSTHCWLQLPYPRLIVEEAPAYPGDAKLTLEQERDIYLHYDLRVTSYPRLEAGS